MVVILISAIAQSAWGQSCIGITNKSVDWWLMFKPPKTQGSKYIYYDSTMEDSNTTELKLVNKSIDTKGQPLDATLTQINDIASIEVLAWNDENQASNSSSSAHSKGVAAYSKKTNKSFILSHSIPKYPNFKGLTVNTSIQSSETTYGQSLFCMSHTLSHLESIAGATKFSKVNTFHNTLVWSKSVQNIVDWAFHNASSTDLISTYNTSFSGTTLVVVSKTNKINGSLWEDGLLPTFNKSFVAETWGRPLEDSYCPSKGNICVNAQNITMQGLTWLQSQDHSKWGISLTSSVSCFGDINRMTSQWKRGGAFYCLKYKNLWNVLNKTFTKMDTCSK